MTYAFPHPLLARDTRGLPHDAALRVCLSDLERMLEYVELHEDNLAVFSHRTYELLLRAATEFEATCKTLLPGGRSRQTIKDFEILSSRFDLPTFGVGFFTGLVRPIVVEPFRAWQQPGTPLPWYQGYNAVKHNRATEFHQASLRNTLCALAAVFVLLYQGFRPRIYHISNAGSDPDTKRWRGYVDGLPVFLETAA